MLNEDYREILQILLEHEVEFLVVGAYAVGIYGYPRATGDVDIWVEASNENSRKIYRSLSVFGAPMSDIAEGSFAERGLVFQIGVAPRRIDIITQIDGVSFEEAWKTREIIGIEGLKVPFISRKDLIRNKRSTGREKDKLDADHLEKNKDCR